MRISDLASLALAPLLALAVTAGCDDDAPPATPDAPPGGIDGPTVDAPMGSRFSFFITSTGGPSGGDFRRTPADTDGLAGADEICRTKAEAGVPGSGSRTWRAYLSTAQINARARIGTGPWFNRNGVMIATSVDNLHDAASNMVNKTTAIDETGAPVPGAGDTPNRHDILTGSTAIGMSATHCNNWTSSAATGVTGAVGHHDRMGGGTDPTSWNAAHPSQGCSAQAFVNSGGRGSFYCFAID